MAAGDKDIFERLAEIGVVYSPAAPVNSKDLFAGRKDQVERVIDAVSTRGQHVVLFGERGVGKTSLANIIREIFSSVDKVVVKVNCSKVDTFHTVWKKALSAVRLTVDSGKSTFGFVPKDVAETVTADRYVPDRPDPHDIRVVLERIDPTLIIFDEFDRLVSKDGQLLFADTIKSLSDSSADCTVMLVGVALDVDQLIAEHQSIDRAIRQVRMPRMSVDELRQIVDTATSRLEMTIEEEAVGLIVLLSQGLPHYTHLLGKASTVVAAKDNRDDIVVGDVEASIQGAIDDTDQTVRSLYQQATASPRTDTIFRQVLLACALAEVDDLGFFAAADVREPLTQIMGKPYDIPNYSQHLDKFSSDSRGRVLEKSGTQRRFRFRFSNPLLQPFVVMRGIADELISGNLLHLLQGKRHG